jgi:hypothetical protein
MSNKQKAVTMSTPEARARAERELLEQLWQDGYQFARQNPDYQYGADEEFEKAKAAAMESEVVGFLELRPLILKEKTR